jgi:hypothetical protein
MVISEKTICPVCYTEGVVGMKRTCTCDIVGFWPKIDETNVKVEESGGMKGDLGKDRWDLVYWPFFIGVVRVLTFGATKYTDNNWKKLSRYRIEGALMRHWTEYKTEGRLDKETKLSHLFHMGCCLMFLCWFDNKEGTDET